MAPGKGRGKRGTMTPGKGRGKRGTMTPGNVSEGEVNAGVETTARTEPVWELLPWRYPFVMIDRLVECVPHERIATIKRVSGDDVLALAHQPGTALFPGVMVLEGMNQSAALLYRLTYGSVDRERLPLLGQLRARFPGSATPGDTIVYSVEAIKMTPTHGLFEGTAWVDGRTIAEGELAFAVTSSWGELR